MWNTHVCTEMTVDRYKHRVISFRKLYLSLPPPVLFFSFFFFWRGGGGGGGEIFVFCCFFWGAR